MNASLPHERKPCCALPGGKVANPHGAMVASVTARAHAQMLVEALEDIEAGRDVAWTEEPIDRFMQQTLWALECTVAEIYLTTGLPKGPPDA